MTLTDGAALSSTPTPEQREASSAVNDGAKVANGIEMEIRSARRSKMVARLRSAGNFLDPDERHQYLE